MKAFTISAFVMALLTIAGCSTTHPAGGVKANSETVMVTYHVRPGKEAEFQALLARAWDVYRNEHLVDAEPHIVVRDADEEGKTKFVEIFTWTKSPDHPPQSIQEVWKREQFLCESRGGHRAIEGGEVEIVTGK